MTQEQFENQWLNKKVRNLGYYQIPDDIYLVTAALLDYQENDITIFAIMSDQYTTENKRWYTIEVGKNEIEDLKNRFEVLDG